ncbi:MAG: ATP-dependent helicase [Lachnospiraceae bacterium]|nr:ATP-dependent helicase [Lachnospiraceae bacterium]
MDTETFLEKYTSHLNENQLRAVRSVDGFILLLAVPGSGKTTVLVTRLGYMLYIAGIKPENILTLTYTVAATKDMASRFESIFGDDYSGMLEFRTINGICAKIIARYADMIGKPAFELITDDAKTGRVLTEILSKNLQEYPTESDVKAARSLITYCKNMLLSDEEIQELGEKEGLPLYEIYKEYNSYLKQNHLMDYDDQMVYAYRLLKVSPELLQYYQDKYRYICVDEAQDTSKIQHIIIKMLAGDNGNLFMVGDEDQSIYGFRAAYPEALLDFEKDHPGAKVLVMDQNYRSNARIVSAADNFIRHNKARHDKHMVAVRGEVAEIRYIDMKSRAGQYNYLAKVAGKCDSQTAVLYRDNESVLPLVDVLDRAGISYRIRNMDMGFFTHRVVTDVTNILKFALNPKDTDLFMQIYFKCQTYLTKSQAQELVRISQERNIPVLDAVSRASGIKGMVKGRCSALKTNLSSMTREMPSKALFRIEKPVGYGEYLERNGMDSNKLYILKMLANRESSIKGYLARLEYLQSMLKRRESDPECRFILSTIHSSKGLEYDRVYLMDVCDGVFPGIKGKGSISVSEQGSRDMEEERRLFYVGITRAKNELSIFRMLDGDSIFINEITSKPDSRKVTDVSTVLGNFKAGEMTSDSELVIGERVVQKQYGAGTVSDVEYDSGGKAKKFVVSFDIGEEKAFMFPVAFQGAMWLEDGREVPLKFVKPNNEPAVKKINKPAKARKTDGRNSYAYWAAKYPDHVVVKREGAFWTCRGESAITLSKLLGYRLGGSGEKPVTGSPHLEPITEGLRDNFVDYIVVVNGNIIEREEF